jgi:hypothetical protein
MIRKWLLGGVAAGGADLAVRPAPAPYVAPVVPVFT